MAEKDFFEQLAQMISEEDMVGQPVTPAFLRLLRLQFTEEEAGLALKMRLTGGTLDQLSPKLGMDSDRLLEKLMAMADKGTVIYDPADEDPVYRSVGTTAGGLTETGAWGGVRFPFSVQLIKEMNQVMKDHAEGALAKLGFAYTPVWAGMLALPEDAAPSENLAEAVKDAGHWSVSLCPCRMSQAMVDPENPCRHMLEACVHTGPLSRWAVKHGMARQLTHEELVELLKKSNQDGLVHTINLLGQICNCCHDCCGIFYSYRMGAPTFIPSPFMARAAEEACTACSTCADRCPVDAIEVGDHAVVDQAECLGCGVCVPTCPAKAIRLVRRPEPAGTPAVGGD
jgi:electron transport complex protein RnfB